MATNTTLDLDNVQGDILVALPKKAEFRTQLGKLIPLITTSTQCLDDRNKIKEEKNRAREEHRKPKLLQLSGINIAFTQKGLDELEINDDIGDTAFKGGMLADSQSLGDDVNKWDERFKKSIHGVILVTGNSQKENSRTLAEVKKIFHVGDANASIEEVLELAGKVRPGKEEGHEHFGFLDAVSQPAVAGVPTVPNAGQETVRQGIILLGREGDDGDVSASRVTTSVKRPSWALDGSFLCFQYLKQLVPEFNNFLDQNALPVSPSAPGDPTGSDLLGARLVGRWKSGAPVDLTPTKDDPKLGANPTLNNNFVYDPRSQERCPFAAHTRKTNPRSDLTFVGGTSEAHRIIRRGIQFGPEVTHKEATSKKSSNDEDLERGLLFVSYQSNIVNGFQFVQKSWANNVAFPPGKDAAPVSPVVPAPGPGFDPVIGEGPTRALVGTNPEAATASLTLSNEWVVPRGGEYFFSPSIRTLKHILV